MQKQQSATAILMVEPTTFGFDEQTAATNTFQHKGSSSKQNVTENALKEFTDFVDTLRANDIEVVTFRDTTDPAKPNAVFPNNWLSMWPDGQVFLYPMATPSRRLERSKAALDLLGKSFAISSVTDLSSAENAQRFLESTGAIVFDHPHELAFGCLSPRCDKDLFVKHVVALGYRPITFHAYDKTGTAIYHTNVVLGVQATSAVICSAAITDPGERARVVESLHKTNHTIVDITQAQLDNFCANVLEVRNRHGQAFLILSQTAYDAFTPAQRTVLSHDKTLLPVAIPTIEKIGGGSARCMVAEIFLPRVN